MSLLERMDQDFKGIDPDNRIMTVEPGVLNGMSKQRQKNMGIFGDLIPPARLIAALGGNLACNAAGPRSLKYGTTRDNVLGLTAMMGTGKSRRMRRLYQ